MTALSATIVDHILEESVRRACETRPFIPRARSQDMKLAAASPLTVSSRCVSLESCCHSTHDATTECPLSPNASWKARSCTLLPSPLSAEAAASAACSFQGCHSTSVDGGLPGLQIQRLRNGRSRSPSNPHLAHARIHV